MRGFNFAIAEYATIIVLWQFSDAPPSVVISEVDCTMLLPCDSRTDAASFYESLMFFLFIFATVIPLRCPWLIAKKS